MQGDRLRSAQAVQKQPGEPSQGQLLNFGSGQPRELHPTTCDFNATRDVYLSGGSGATAGSACGLLSTPTVSSARCLQYYKRECTVGRACYALHAPPLILREPVGVS